MNTGVVTHRIGDPDNVNWDGDILGGATTESSEEQDTDPTNAAPDDLSGENVNEHTNQFRCGGMDEQM